MQEINEAYLISQTACACSSGEVEMDQVSGWKEHLSPSARHTQQTPSLCRTREENCGGTNQGSALWFLRFSLRYEIVANAMNF